MGLNIGPPPRLVPKTALIDVDGVVADFTPWLLHRVDSRLTKNDITAWDIFGFLSGPQKALAERILGKKEFWLELPVIAGARDGIGQLRTLGYEVVWVTAPWGSLVGWETYRREWLAKTFGAKPKDIVSCPRKDILHGDLFIDDKPEHVAGIRATPALLFDQPYNQAFTWPKEKRLMGWEDLDRALKDLVKA